MSSKTTSHTALLKISLSMVVLICLFASFISIAVSQKFPSCLDEEGKRKTVSLLTRWFERETKTAAGGDVKLLSVDIQRIWPRDARFGNYSGILECEVTANVSVIKLSTGQRFLLPAFKDFVLYFGYDQNGNLVVQTPSGFE